MFYSKDVDKMSADIREARDPYKDNIILNGGNPEYLEANNLTLSETPANWLEKPVPKWKSFDVENVAEEEEEKEEKDEEALIEEFTSGTMNRGFSVLWNYEENGTYPFRDASNILYDSGIFFPKINGKPIFDPEALEVEKSRWGLENVALFSFNMTKGAVDLARFHELDDRTQLAYFQALDLYNTKLPMLYYDDREDGNEPWYKQTNWDGIFRAVHGIASDPATYIGLGIYNQVPKLTANLSGKKITTEILKKMLSPTALAVYEGGTWAGVANYQAQQIEIEGAGQNPIVQDKIEQAGEENPYKTELDKGELAFNIGIGSIIGPAFEQAVPLTKLAYNKLNEIYTKIKKPSGDSGGGSVDIDNPDNLSTKEALLKTMDEKYEALDVFSKEHDIESPMMMGRDDENEINFYPKSDQFINKLELDPKLKEEYRNLQRELYDATVEFDNAPITLYHGSPHEFDQFDISKIGSGEGHQAYGHGLYFAEAEAVSEVYRGYLGKRLEIDGVETIKDGRRTNLSDSLDGDEAQKYRTWSDMLKHYDPEEMPELTLQEVVEEAFKEKSHVRHIETTKNDLEERIPKRYAKEDHQAEMMSVMLERTIDHLNKNDIRAIDFLESLTVNRNDGTSLYNRVPDNIKYGDLSEEEFFSMAGITGDNRLRWVGLTYKDLLNHFSESLEIDKGIDSFGVSDRLQHIKDNPQIIGDLLANRKAINKESYEESISRTSGDLEELILKQTELEDQTKELMDLIDQGKIKIENTGKMYKSDVDIKKHQTIDFDEFVEGDAKESLINLIKEELKNDNINFSLFRDNIEVKLGDVYFDSETLTDMTYMTYQDSFEETYVGEALDIFLENIFNSLKGADILISLKNSFRSVDGEEPVELLRKALVNNNIKGLKFDDQMSRGSNKDVGTHNYVIYDDRIINIVKRYGVPVPIAGYMLTQLDGQNNNQDQIN